MRHIVGKKPTFLLFEEDHEQHKGIKSLEKVLCEENGFSAEMLRTLILRFPTVLSKTEDEVREYFNIMGKYDINKQDAMDYLLQCPKIITVDIE